MSGYADAPAATLELQLQLATSLLAQIPTFMPFVRKVQSAFEMASSYADGVIKIALLPEIEKRSFTRIGLIGGTAHSVAYLRHLQEAGLEVILVAVESAEVWPQRDESERQLSALCHDIEVPYFFSLANIPPGLEDCRTSSGHSAWGWVVIHVDFFGHV